MTVHRSLLLCLALVLGTVRAEFCEGYTDARGNKKNGFNCPRGSPDGEDDVCCCKAKNWNFCCDKTSYNIRHGMSKSPIAPNVVTIVVMLVLGIIFVLVILMNCLPQDTGRHRNRYTGEPAGVYSPSAPVVPPPTEDMAPPPYNEAIQYEEPPHGQAGSSGNNSTAPLL